MTAVVPISEHEGQVDGTINLALTDDVVCGLVILAAREPMPFQIVVGTQVVHI